jgi:hypothetical protein
MLETILVMATITIIACAAVIAFHELLARVRHPSPKPAIAAADHPADHRPDLSG